MRTDAIEPVHQVSWQGRFFEDFNVGDVYQHPLGRTILDADNVWFTLLTMNTAQPHFNVQFAAEHMFGKPLVNSCLTISVITGLSVTDISQNGAANLGWDQIRLPHPVFVGDTLYAESRVLATRPSKSRPDVGIVTVRTRGFNQHGDVVVSFTRSVMVNRRASGSPLGRFPSPKTPITEEDRIDIPAKRK
jgi:itaconyl-CoA hydratase